MSLHIFAFPLHIMDDFYTGTIMQSVYVAWEEFLKRLKKLKVDSNGTIGKIHCQIYQLQCSLRGQQADDSAWNHAHNAEGKVGEIGV